MKKLLLTTAVAGLAFAAPAHAEVNLEVGGYFSAYGAFVDQDENNGQAEEFDLIKNTEIHFSGETVLDNGLTVGAHIEFDIDGADDNASVEENYAYFSGSWGRVNVGEEDGAAYLLQVAAPSATNEIDGVRHVVDAINESVLGLSADANSDGVADVTSLDYDHSITNYNTKLTYLSPVVNGFQLGLSYTPDSDADSSDRTVGGSTTASTWAETYEVAARYEGEYEGVGVTVGAGYSVTDLEAAVVTGSGAQEERAVWNTALDLDFGPIGFGVAYTEDDHGDEAVSATETMDDEEIFVVGVDYTTGPFKLGASYYDAENVEGNNDVDAQRYTGGVVYTYGPGMTLSGTVAYVEYEGEDVAGTDIDDADATQFLVGTKFKF